MKAIVFPGQGAQFEGMGKELYDQNPSVQPMFAKANEIVGFDLQDIMFNGSSDDLKQTKVTQPAIFLYSLATFQTYEIDSEDIYMAGHSLGEITALVAAGSLTFEEGIYLVKERAFAMQDACENNPGTMAAILRLENDKIEEICQNIEEIVVPANYNCPGQLVISGSINGINKAVELCTEAGARRAVVLEVGGAFHSPLMKSAETRLSEAIGELTFKSPAYPVIQNVTAKPSTDPEEIKDLLKKQLTSPVKWSQTLQTMQSLGVESHIEIGAKVLTGFIRKFDRNIEAITV